MVPAGHRQAVRDGQPVPVHLEICGTTGKQRGQVIKRRKEAVTQQTNVGPTATV